MSGVWSRKWRMRITAIGVMGFAFTIGWWPVSIVLSKSVRLVDKKEELRPGLSARGAFANSGSRDVGPDPENPLRNKKQ